MIHGILLDLRTALRSLRRSRTFTATVIAVLALGVGANTAVFSVVRTVLLQPLPFPDPDRLVALWVAYRGQQPACLPRGFRRNEPLPLAVLLRHSAVRQPPRRTPAGGIVAAFHDGRIQANTAITQTVKGAPSRTHRSGSRS